jgi:hypothetical protein
MGSLKQYLKKHIFIEKRSKAEHKIRGAYDGEDVDVGLWIVRPFRRNISLHHQG